MKRRELLVGKYYALPDDDSEGNFCSVIRIDSHDSSDCPMGPGIVYENGKPKRLYKNTEGNWSNGDRVEATQEQIRYLEACLAAGELVPEEPPTTDNYLTFN